MVSIPRHYSEVAIDLREIVDVPSFRAVFKREMGFPEFYGSNMSAWVDCMTCVDAPEDRMSAVHAPKDGVLVLILDSVGDFKKRCPEIFDALIGSAAFVNYRRMERGDPPVITLSYIE